MYTHYYRNLSPTAVPRAACSCAAESKNLVHVRVRAHSSMYTMVYTAVSHMVLNDLLNGCPIYIKKADCFGTRVPWNGSEARIHVYSCTTSKQV